MESELASTRCPGKSWGHVLLGLLVSLHFLSTLIPLSDQMLISNAVWHLWFSLLEIGCILGHRLPTGQSDGLTLCPLPSPIHLPHRIPPNIRDIVYCTGVSLMDEDVWEFIWMKFHSTNAVSEKKILLEALTCSDNTFLLNRYQPHCLFCISEHFWTHTKRMSWFQDQLCMFLI